MSANNHISQEDEKIQKDNQGKQSSKHYTAVIYVHGMGSQRRNEEVSNLIDQLDNFSYKANDLGVFQMS